MNDSDWRPTATWDRLRLRADLLRRLREFFHTRGFLEVDTPLLSHDTVVDRRLHPLYVAGTTEPGSRDRGEHTGPGWLQTSPEFHMKRLLAAGAPAIYQIARAFRAGEQGPLHNLEFTIVEWYGPGEDLAAAMQFTSDLCQQLLDWPAAQEVTYRDAFQKHARVDPHLASLEALRESALRAGLSPAETFATADRDEWLDLLLAELVQPNLGRGGPTLLWGYPASQAALAEVDDGPPPVARRFELFYEGVELANGYQELRDADEMRRRIESANRQRAADGAVALPAENRLLAAMESRLPPCAGVALGFDRLVMLAAGGSNIESVMAFPAERA